MGVDPVRVARRASGGRGYDRLRRRKPGGPHGTNHRTNGRKQSNRLTARAALLYRPPSRQTATRRAGSGPPHFLDNPCVNPLHLCFEGEQNGRDALVTTYLVEDGGPEHDDGVFLAMGLLAPGRRTHWAADK
jgi:hypothetical protein